MSETNHKYVYDGPVMVFDKLVANHWKSETMAPSEQKAKSNLLYQVKQKLNLLPSSRVSLPGKIKMVS